MTSKKYISPRLRELLSYAEWITRECGGDIIVSSSGKSIAWHLGKDFVVLVCDVLDVESGTMLFARIPGPSYHSVGPVKWKFPLCLN